MKIESLTRWSGMLAIVDGVLFLLWWFLLATLVPNTAAGGEAFDMVGMVRKDGWLAINAIGSVATMLLPIVLIGFFLRHIEDCRLLGLIGLVMSILGLQLYVWIQVDENILWPLLAIHAPDLVNLKGPMFSDPAFNFTYLFMGFLFIPGVIIFGISMFKSLVFPNWSVWMLMSGATLFGIGGPMIVVRTIGIVLLAGSLIWIGKILWKEKRK